MEHDGNPRRPRWRRWYRATWIGGVALLLSVCAVIVFLARTERHLPLPAGVTERIEARIDRNIAPYGLDLGRITVGLDRGFVPRLWLEDVRFIGLQGAPVADLAEIGTAFDPAALMERRIAPRALRVRGAEITLRRDRNGAFEFRLGGGDAMGFDGPGAVLDAMDAAMARPPFDRVETVAFGDAQVMIEDARSGRVWTVTRAEATLDRAAEGLEIAALAEIFNGTDDIAQVQASLSTSARTGAAELQANVRDAPARDLALQSPALAFLSGLDAPLSGAFRAAFDTSGAPESMSGTMSIGAGALQPRAGVAPVPFDGARLYIEYDPATGRLRMPQLRVVLPEMTAQLGGHVDLRDMGPGGFPNSLEGQFGIEELAVSAEMAGGFFRRPIMLSGGQVDMRVRLDPFTVDFGQIALRDGASDNPPRYLRARGQVRARPDGWDIALDGRTDRLEVARLLDLWPVPIAPGARNWVARHVKAGTMTGAEVAFRLAPGQGRPLLNTTFAFEGAEVVPFGDFAPITDGRGWASITGDRLSARLDAGRIGAPGADAVALGGSSFTIADTSVKPARAEAEIAASGRIPDIAALIDQEPLRLISRTGRDADLANGRGEVQATVTFPIQRGNTAEDFLYTATGTLRDVVSERIVAGRRIAAESLRLDVSREAISLTGAATFDGVPFDGLWRQALSGETRGAGRIAGQVVVSPSNLAALGIPLPEGLVTGSGPADVTLTLAPETPPAFEVASRLDGIGLDVPGTGWSLPPGGTGDFAASGRLGLSPRVDALSLTAPGLEAQGSLTVENGRLGALDLRRVAIGGWLDGAVRIAGRGPGTPPSIAVNARRLDIRRANMGGGDGTGSARGPVVLAAERLILTDTIALTDVAVDLAAGRALRGAFAGRVNGGAVLRGRLDGGARGVALRVTGGDAGAILSDTGLFRRLDGGSLDLRLEPAGSRGVYDGTIKVSDITLRDAPAIANLLSAISVVGLVEQLNRGGIAFDDVSAEFRLSPDRVTLYRSSAVGASLGLSMDGTFDLGTRRMDMQGVVSPFYLLNSIGSVFTRRGEGLFGVNFTLRGPASGPRVSANPLSILTPGAFRDIFRSPPPSRTSSR